jgi:dTDP-4-dehydrorhamnose 3,5-epimerase
MKVQALNLDGALLLTPTIYKDERGSFCETYNKQVFTSITQRDINFVQDNVSVSTKNTIRGLHYQSPNEQGKLVRVVRGKVYDVIVDIRTNSPTFGQWQGIELSDDGTQLWVPIGFAHGFMALTDEVEFMYKVTDYYTKSSEQSIRWNDPTLNIQWPITDTPIISDKDREAPLFNEIVF